MIANISNPSTNYGDGNDSISVVDSFQTLRGGYSLDTTGFTPTMINSGHVIIRSTATGQYKPMPVSGTLSIGSLGLVLPGSGYTPLTGNSVTYTAVALTGGSGTGATANITVNNGQVTAVVIVNKGTGYTAGNILSAAAADIGTTGTGFTVSIQNTNEAGAYAAIPASHTYAGILVNSILTVKPFAAIMVRGNVNPVAAPYDLLTIAAAVKTALPTITIIAD